MHLRLSLWMKHLYFADCPSCECSVGAIHGVQSLQSVERHHIPLPCYDPNRSLADIWILALKALTYIGKNRWTSLHQNPFRAVGGLGVFGPELLYHGGWIDANTVPQH